MFKKLSNRKQLFSNVHDGNGSNGPGESFFSSLNLNKPDGGAPEAAQPSPGGAPVDPNAPANSNDPNINDPVSAQASVESDQPTADDRVKALESQIQMLTGMIQNQQAPAVDSTPEPESQSPFESESFTNLATAMDWSQEESSAMKNFLQQVTDFNNQSVLSEATQSVSSIVNSAMSAQEKRQAVRTKFFSDHPALKPMNLYVNEMAKTVAQEFKSQGKSLDPAVILNEAAARSYSALGIPKQPTNQQPNAAQNSQSGRDTNPAFASGSGQGARSPVVKKSVDKQMIDAIIDLT